MKNKLQPRHKMESFIALFENKQYADAHAFLIAHDMSLSQKTNESTLSLAEYLSIYIRSTPDIFDRRAGIIPILDYLLDKNPEIKTMTNIDYNKHIVPSIHENDLDVFYKNPNSFHWVELYRFLGQADKAIDILKTVPKDNPVLAITINNFNTTPTPGFFDSEIAILKYLIEDFPALEYHHLDNNKDNYAQFADYLLALKDNIQAGMFNYSIHEIYQLVQCQYDNGQHDLSDYFKPNIEAILEVFQPVFENQSLYLHIFKQVIRSTYDEISISQSYSNKSNILPLLEILKEKYPDIPLDSYVTKNDFVNAPFFLGFIPNSIFDFYEDKNVLGNSCIRMDNWSGRQRDSHMELVHSTQSPAELAIHAFGSILTSLLIENITYSFTAHINADKFELVAEYKEKFPSEYDSDLKKIMNNIHSLSWYEGQDIRNLNEVNTSTSSGITAMILDAELPTHNKTKPVRLKL